MIPSNLFASSISNIKSFSITALGGIPFVGSILTSETQEFDEKHYVLVPSLDGRFVLYSARKLPAGLPAHNELKKRRVFHIHHESALDELKRLLLKTEFSNIDRAALRSGGVQRLNDFADFLDEAERTVSGGSLLVGGLLAFVNPVAGAAIVVNALMPSVGLSLGRSGVKSAAEALSGLKERKAEKEAESKVLSQFKDSLTIVDVNPILSQLEGMLNGQKHDGQDLPLHIDLAMEGNADNACVVIAALHEVASQISQPKKLLSWGEAPPVSKSFSDFIELTKPYLNLCAGISEKGCNP